MSEPIPVPDRPPRRDPTTQSDTEYTQDLLRSLIQRLDYNNELTKQLIGLLTP